MIIDSNLVFTDAPVTATGASDPVALTSLYKPGRAEPIPILVRVTEDFAALTSLTVKITECATKDGTYTDVPAASMTIPLADLKTGKKFGWRYLPANVDKPWLKLAYTVTGTAPTAGKVFAAIMREIEEAYEAGMYIDAGVVKG